MTDRIELRGLRALGVHGVLPEEQAPGPAVRGRPRRRRSTWRAAGRSDELADTVDYGAVAAAVAERVVSGERCHLLERLAERIAEEVLATERRMRR